MPTFAVDLSNYTTRVPVEGAGANGGRISSETIDCWKTNGFTHAVVGTQWPGVVRHQLEVCRAGGMTSDAYHWLWFDRDYRAELQRSVAAVRDFPIRRFWVDIEDTVTGKSPAELVQISHEVVDLAEQLKTGLAFDLGIYTGRWWWVPKMANHTGLSRYPLWHAQYFQPVEGAAPTRVPSEADFASFASYGGWLRPSLWQYAGSVGAICSCNLDYNVSYESIVRAGAQEEEMIRHNSVSTRLQGATGGARVELKDFDQPPAAARRLRVEVYLTNGIIEVLDGDGRYAGQVGWGGERYGVVDVDISPGFFTFRGTGVISQLGLVGYWA